MNWYYAENVNSECWAFAGTSRDEAIDEGRQYFSDVEAFAVAPERQPNDKDYWLDVADVFTRNLDWLEEQLIEDNLIDPENPWLETGFAVHNLKVALARSLALHIKRPEWRCVEAGEWIGTNPAPQED